MTHKYTILECCQHNVLQCWRKEGARERDLTSTSWHVEIKVYWDMQPTQSQLMRTRIQVHCCFSSQAGTYPPVADFQFQACACTWHAWQCKADVDVLTNVYSNMSWIRVKSCGHRWHILCSMSKIRLHQWAVIRASIWICSKYECQACKSGTSVRHCSGCIACRSLLEMLTKHIRTIWCSDLLLKLTCWLLIHRLKQGLQVWSDTSRLCWVLWLNIWHS